jgi:nicotinamidase-related amidase
MFDGRDTQPLILLVTIIEYWSECEAVRQDFPHFPSRISSLVSHCRNEKTKCIWVRADYNFEKSPWLLQFSRLHQGRIPPVVQPNSRWESFAEPQEDEFVMTKTSWSSTSDTKLLNVLKESGIDTVLVCGLITSVCVQHSAFGIFEAGFRTILVTDACADRGKARHEAALALYGDYMYELRTVESLKRELRAFTEDPTMAKPLPSNGSLSTLQTEHPTESESSDYESHDDEPQPSWSRTRYVSVTTGASSTSAIG